MSGPGRLFIICYLKMMKKAPKPLLETCATAWKAPGTRTSVSAACFLAPEVEDSTIFGRFNVFPT